MTRLRKPEHLPVETRPDLSDIRLRKILGRRIKTLRQQRNWTQQQLAAKARVQPNTIRGIEFGKIHSRYSNVVRVCAALGTTPSVVAHVLEGERDVWLNPLVKDLVREDLEIAQRYHHASSAVRAWIDAALMNREKVTGPPPPTDLVALAHRFVQLEPTQLQVVYLLLQQFEGARRRRRGRRQGSAADPLASVVLLDGKDGKGGDPNDFSDNDKDTAPQQSPPPTTPPPPPAVPADRVAAHR